METVELRPLSLGELLDRTFNLYRNHFWLFVCIMAVPSAFTIPANVLLLSFQGSMMNSIATNPGRPPMVPSLSYFGGIFLGYLVFFVIFGIVYSMAVAAASSAVADVYLGRVATVRGSFGRLRGRFWTLMGVVLNVFLRLLGIFLLIVIVLVAGVAGASFAFAGGPGNPVFAVILGFVVILAYLAGLAFCFYFVLRYAVSIPVLMVENLGILATLRRSVFLTRGRRGHIFLALLIAGVIAGAGVAVFQWPFLIAEMIAAGRGHWSTGLALASAVSGGIGSSLTGPISMIAVVLLYYDARIRKEAFDLQFMMSSLDSSAPAAGTVSPA
jgi:hypothetical protein